MYFDIRRGGTGTLKMALEIVNRHDITYEHLKERLNTTIRIKGLEIVISGRMRRSMEK